MNHVLMTLPPLPYLTEIETRHAFPQRDLLLHLADLVDPHVGEEVGELRWFAVLSCTVSPVVCAVKEALIPLV